MKAINFYNKAQERLILMENKVYEAKISILYNLYCGELKIISIIVLVILSF